MSRAWIGQQYKNIGWIPLQNLSWRADTVFRFYYISIINRNGIGFRNIVLLFMKQKMLQTEFS